MGVQTGLSKPYPCIPACNFKPIRLGSEMETFVPVAMMLVMVGGTRTVSMATVLLVEPPGVCSPSPNKRPHRRACTLVSVRTVRRLSREQVGRVEEPLIRRTAPHPVAVT